MEYGTSSSFRPTGRDRLLETIEAIDENATRCSTGSCSYASTQVRSWWRRVALLGGLAAAMGAGFYRAKMLAAHRRGERVRALERFWEHPERMGRTSSATDPGGVAEPVRRARQCRHCKDGQSAKVTRRLVCRSEPALTPVPSCGAPCAFGPIDFGSPAELGACRGVAHPMRGR